MTMRASLVQHRADVFDAQGVLRVVRPPLPPVAATPGQPVFVHSQPDEGMECLIALWDDGSVTAMHGHVDLGTGLRTLVLVNDFGAVAIDDEFVTSRDGDIITLTNGCVCCGLTAPLAEAMANVRSLGNPPELIIIETSGVADPRSVAAHAMVPGFHLDGIVIVADGETVRRRARDRLVGRTVLRQLSAADLIVLNKVDLVGPEAQADLTTWLRSAARGANVVPAIHGVVPIDLVVGAATPGPPQARDVDIEPHAAHDTWSWSGPVLDPHAFEEWLDALPDDVVRVKGVVTLAGRGRTLVQRVGLRRALSPAPPGDGPGRLVVIGLPATLDAAVLATGVAACLAG